MKIIDPEELSTSEFYQYMVEAVVPRPIAFASTVDQEGRVNLSPYSFFNAMSSHPPVLVFSPVNRTRDNTSKDTLDNVRQHGEVVINIVNYAVAEQMSLASTGYERGGERVCQSRTHRSAFGPRAAPRGWRSARWPSSAECSRLCR